MHEENKNQNKFSCLVKLKLHMQQKMEILTSTVFVEGAIKFIMTQVTKFTLSIRV